MIHLKIKNIVKNQQDITDNVLTLKSDNRLVHFSIEADNTKLELRVRRHPLK